MAAYCIFAASTVSTHRAMPLADSNSGVYVRRQVYMVAVASQQILLSDWIEESGSDAVIEHPGWGLRLQAEFHLHRMLIPSAVHK